MVQPKANRPKRRPKGAGPKRDGDDDEAIPVLATDRSPNRYPNMTAQREMDRQEHMRRARELGATRKQASRHADEEVGGH
jgi:hypothetical protein